MPKYANESQIGGDHYKQGGSTQHWDFMTANFGGSYLIGCATKYVTRWRKKNGTEDLLKAAHYCHKLQEVAEDNQIHPGHSHRLDVSAFFKANDIPEEEAQIILLIVNWHSPWCFKKARELILDLAGAEEYD
jgi:hypothetical protein